MELWYGVYLFFIKLGLKLLIHQPLTYNNTLPDCIGEQEQEPLCTIWIQSVHFVFDENNYNRMLVLVILSRDWQRYKYVSYFSGWVFQIPDS